MRNLINNTLITKTQVLTMNLKKILLSALALGALTAQAQKTPVWCDPNVNEINRKMDVASYLPTRVRSWHNSHKRQRQTRRLSQVAT